MGSAIESGAGAPDQEADLARRASNWKHQGRVTVTWRAGRHGEVVRRHLGQRMLEEALALLS